MRIVLLIIVFGPWLLAGCGDDRDVRDPDTYYACSGNQDCVSGYSCACGWCQPIGNHSIKSCADAAGQVDAGIDAGSPNKDAGSTVPDAGPVFKNCNLATWAGCGNGQGCYYDQKLKKKFCQNHGAKKQGDTCATGLQECAREGTTPLLCDAVDGICYPLCHVDTGICPSLLTCFTLVEGQNGPPLPDKVGICAPN